MNKLELRKLIQEIILEISYYDTRVEVDPNDMYGVILRGAPNPKAKYTYKIGDELVELVKTVDDKDEARRAAKHLNSRVRDDERFLVKYKVIRMTDKIKQHLDLLRPSKPKAVRLEPKFCILKYGETKKYQDPKKMLTLDDKQYELVALKSTYEQAKIAINKLRADAPAKYKGRIEYILRPYDIEVKEAFHTKQENPIYWVLKYGDLPSDTDSKRLFMYDGTLYELVKDVNTYGQAKNLAGILTEKVPKGKNINYKVIVYDEEFKSKLTPMKQYDLMMSLKGK